ETGTFALLAEDHSGWLPKHKALRDFAGGDHAPERDEQLAGESDDHRRLARALGSLGPITEPLGQRAVLLEPQEAPGELDQAAAHPGIAGFGEPFLASLGAAFIGRAGEPGVACDSPAIAQVTREHFLHQHVGRLDADPKNAGQQSHHGMRSGLWCLLQTLHACAFNRCDLLAHNGQPIEVAPHLVERVGRLERLQPVDLTFRLPVAQALDNGVVDRSKIPAQHRGELSHAMDRRSLCVVQPKLKLACITASQDTTEPHHKLAPAVNSADAACPAVRKSAATAAAPFCGALCSPLGFIQRLPRRGVRAVCQNRVTSRPTNPVAFKPYLPFAALPSMNCPSATTPICFVTSSLACGCPPSCGEAPLVNRFWVTASTLASIGRFRIVLSQCSLTTLIASWSFAATPDELKTTAMLGSSIQSICRFPLS